MKTRNRVASKISFDFGQIPSCEISKNVPHSAPECGIERDNSTWRPENILTFPTLCSTVNTLPYITSAIGRNNTAQNPGTQSPTHTFTPHFLTNQNLRDFLPGLLLCLHLSFYICLIFSLFIQLGSSIWIPSHFEPVRAVEWSSDG